MYEANYYISDFTIIKKVDISLTQRCNGSILKTMNSINKSRPPPLHSWMNTVIIQEKKIL